MSNTGDEHLEQARRKLEAAVDALEEAAMALHNTARTHRTMADGLHEQSKSLRESLRKLNKP